MKDIHSWPVPPELSQLELYAADAKLCTRWYRLYRGWQLAYPRINITAEIAKAHAWELSNPKKQKRDKIRFLNNWLKSTYERKAETGTLGHQQVKTPPVVCPDCKGTGMRPVKKMVPTERWGETVMEEREVYEPCPH